jgi:DNA anti-recombination protein RmuC
METTFRSLMDDLAQRADELVEKNLTKLRKGVEQTGVQHAKYLDDEAEAHLGKFQERLEKQARQMADRLEKMQAETEGALQQSVEAIMQQFEAGFSGLLRELQHAAESHKPSHAATAARRK